MFHSACGHDGKLESNAHACSRAPSTTGDPSKRQSTFLQHVSNMLPLFAAYVLTMPILLAEIWTWALTTL